VPEYQPATELRFVMSEKTLIESDSAAVALFPAASFPDGERLGVDPSLAAPQVCEHFDPRQNV